MNIQFIHFYFKLLLPEKHIQYEARAATHTKLNEIHNLVLISLDINRTFNNVNQ